MLSFVNRFILYLGISFLFCACSPKEVQIPADIIPQEKMVILMTDVLILESIYNQNKQGNDSTITVRDSYQNIFRKHGVTDSLFDKSFKFYTDNPEFLKEIYTEVITEISTMQADVSNRGKNLDSLNKSLEKKVDELDATKK